MVAVYYYNLLFCLTQNVLYKMQSKDQTNINTEQRIRSYSVLAKRVSHSVILSDRHGYQQW
jgi:hypothetical protein